MTRPHSPLIHPTAVVSAQAVLAPDVRVGPFAVIDGPVTLGPGCVVHAHARLIGPLVAGANNQFWDGAVIGGPPQHLGYKGEPTDVRIGDGNVFREHVTIHRAMPVGAGAGVTTVGNNNFLMAGAHIAHDCVIGNNIIMANCALVGGHAEIGDRAFLSGNAAVHQFCRIGRLAMLGGTSGATKDMPPFWVVQNVNRVAGVNVVGMKRAGFTQADIMAVTKAFRIIYLEKTPVSTAVDRMEAELGDVPAVMEVVEFIRTSKRGICGPSHFERNGLDAAA